MGGPRGATILVRGVGVSRSDRAEARQPKERGPLAPPASVAREVSHLDSVRIRDAHQWALTEYRPLEWVTFTTSEWLLVVLQEPGYPGLLERLILLGHMARFGGAKAQAEEQLLSLTLFEAHYLARLLESRMAEVEELSWDLEDGHTTHAVLAWEGARSALYALELTGLKSPQLQNLRDWMGELDTLFEGGPTLEGMYARGSMAYMLPQP